MGHKRENRLRVYEANYGRDFGWFVEKNGRRLAVLIEPRFVDIFWYSYVVEPLGETDAERRMVFTKDFWAQTALVFRNRVTSDVAPNAFPGGGTPTEESPRIMMRALYSSLVPTALERVLLWLKRMKSR